MTTPVLKSDKGAVVTVWGQFASNRWAIVIPVATDDTGVSRLDLCGKARDAVAAIVNGTNFTDLLSADCSIMAIQAHGMDDGCIPAAVNYSVTDHPGTGGAAGPPPTVGGLITFYPDPLDVPAGQRLPHSREIVPGIPAAALVDGTVTAAFQAKMALHAGDQVDGFNDGGTGPTFYRVLAAPKRGAGGHPPATTLTRLVSSALRAYCGTVRLRGTPHYV